MRTILYLQLRWKLPANPMQSTNPKDDENWQWLLEKLTALSQVTVFEVKYKFFASQLVLGKHFDIDMILK